MPRREYILSIAQRDLVIAHIDGPQAAAVKEGLTRRFLMERGILISCDRDGVRRNRTQNVHYTMITEDGREAMAQILADYAEALVRAGCLDAVPVSLIPRAEAFRRQTETDLQPAPAESLPA